MCIATHVSTTYHATQNPNYVVDLTSLPSRFQSKQEQRMRSFQKLACGCQHEVFSCFSYVKCYVFIFHLFALRPIAYIICYLSQNIIIIAEVKFFFVAA
jgi:hypothetical protein